MKLRPLFSTDRTQAKSVILSEGAYGFSVSTAVEGPADLFLPQHPRVPGHAHSQQRRRPSTLTRLSLTLTLVALSLGVQAGCRAEQPWPLWQAYNQRMIAGDGRVLDRTAGDRTTSEAQAYAMFFALVANDRPEFDKLLHWTESNLAGNDLTTHLPAWSWGKNPDGSWKIMDPNPASDADLWLAYDLLEAGRLWREPRYERLGTLVAPRIAQAEVAPVLGVGTTLLPGAVGFHPDLGTWILNPSYLPPFVLVRLSNAFPEGPWNSILGSLNPILTKGSPGGFAMDWVAAGFTVTPSLSPTQIAAGDFAARPIGSYDAIRVYLWLGMSDKSTPGLKGFFDATSGMAAYLKRQVTPPHKVDGQGTVLATDAPVGFSAAVVPYLQALNLRAQEKIQLDRIGAFKDQTSGLYGKDPAYYDQNLILFATGWTEGRFHFDRDGKLVTHWR